MRVFLDVGAHEGQTLEVVLGRFEKIFAFEPMPAQYAILAERFGDDPKVELLDYGLAGFTGDASVFGTNEQMEASLYAGKQDVDETVSTMCRFRRASEFFNARLEEADDVVVKLNCEGAEVAIMHDLLDSGEAWKIRHVMIDFDVRKIPNRAWMEEGLLKRMRREGFVQYSIADEVMVGATHADRTNRWLEGVGVAT